MNSRVPKRKRGRPRKKPRDSDEEFELKKKLNFEDWVIQHIFKCATCDESIQGFQPALDHVTQKHSEKSQNENSGKPSYPCILCPMTFGRRELVKRHLKGHILEAEENEEPEPEINSNTFLDFEDRFVFLNYILNELVV